MGIYHEVDQKPLTVEIARFCYCKPEMPDVRVNSNGAANLNPADKIKLVFNQYGNRYFLSDLLVRKHPRTQTAEDQSRKEWLGCCVKSRERASRDRGGDHPAGGVNTKVSKGKGT